MQMSFAAVMALLAGHEAFGRRLAALHRGQWLAGRAAAYLLGLMLTSMLAGTATLPFGAYHFGRVQFYFALSNLLAVPLTGVLVMPAGMLGTRPDAARPRAAGADRDGLGERGGAVDRPRRRRAAGRDDAALRTCRHGACWPWRSA